MSSQYIGDREVTIEEYRAHEELMRPVREQLAAQEEARRLRYQQQVEEAQEAFASLTSWQWDRFRELYAQSGLNPYDCQVDEYEASVAEMVDMARRYR